MTMEILSSRNSNFSPLRLTVALIWTGIFVYLNVVSTKVGSDWFGLTELLSNKGGRIVSEQTWGFPFPIYFERLWSGPEYKETTIFWGGIILDVLIWGIPLFPVVLIVEAFWPSRMSLSEVRARNEQKTSSKPPDSSSLD